MGGWNQKNGSREGCGYFLEKQNWHPWLTAANFIRKKGYNLSFFFKMAIMYHGRVDILDLDATFSHLRSRGHIPSRFNRAAWDRLAIRTANLNSTGNVTTIFDRRFVRFSRQRLVNLIEDTIASPAVSYTQGNSEVFERSFSRRIGRRAYWGRGGKLRHRNLYRVRVVTISGTDIRTRRRYYRVVTACPI